MNDTPQRSAPSKARILKAFLLSPLLAISPVCALFMAAFMDMAMSGWIFFYIILFPVVCAILLAIPICYIFLKYKIQKKKYYVLTGGVLGVLIWPILGLINKVCKCFYLFMGLYGPTWPDDLIFMIFGFICGTIAGAIFFNILYYNRFYKPWRVD